MWGKVTWRSSDTVWPLCPIGFKVLEAWSWRESPVLQMFTMTGALKLSDIVQIVCPSTLDEKSNVQQSQPWMWEPTFVSIHQKVSVETNVVVNINFKYICTLVRRYTTRLGEISDFPSCNKLIFLYTCRRSRLSARGPRRRAGGAWVGVNDSDIITACRLVLFQCPDTDRSSIVPALRGLPKVPMC